MPTPPTPEAVVPDFIVDRFDDHSPEELRDIAAYAETRTDSDAVPRYVVQAFAIQDDETVAAVAIYAVELADYLEALEEADQEEDSDDTPPAPGRMGGAFFG